MAVPAFLDLFAADVLCVSGDSLTNGNNDVSVKVTRGLRPFIQPFFQRSGSGLARIPGAAVPCITMYDMGYPVIHPSGVAGDGIQDCTANFATRVGDYTPNVAIFGLGANNFGDGQAATRTDALIAKIVDPTQYLGNRVPNGWLWWGCAWRGQELPGGTNQAALTTLNQTIIKPKVEAAGGIFIDTQAIWLALNPVPPPGTFTADGTHFTQAGSTFVAGLIVAKLKFHFEMRGWQTLAS